MKRILITGSSGYIGSKLVRALSRDKKVEVMVGIDITPQKPASMGSLRNKY